MFWTLLYIEYTPLVSSQQRRLQDTNDFTTLNDTFTFGWAGSSVASFGHLIYIFGGFSFSDGTTTDSLFILDTNLLTLTISSSSLSYSVGFAGVQIVNDQFWIMGGLTHSNIKTI